MSNAKLPERASLEYLKKLAKDRLQEMRRTDPHTRLAAALLAVAREHGFNSWRALKAEIEDRESKDVGVFFDACASGDVEAIRRCLATNPALVRATKPGAHYAGLTGLHVAAQRGHAAAVRLLLDQGADPNAREAGDNTYPLHWAAAHGSVDVVRMLLDGGGDVHGLGDVHELDVIGWATIFRDRGDDDRGDDDRGDDDRSDDDRGNDDPATVTPARRALVSLLVERGAQHHIFSAMAMDDLDLIRAVVEQNPDAIDRRMSRFEAGQTPLHFAINRKRDDILDLLIDLGADVEAKDNSGRTALAVAMLRGDDSAMRRLHAAGARAPKAVAPSSFAQNMARLASSVKKGVPMISVPNVANALEWYVSIGFKELARFDDDGEVNFGMVSFGGAELMFNSYGTHGRDVSLWFYTDKIDELYQLLKSRQLEAANATLAGKGGNHQGIVFEQDIENMFYGARQFAIKDLNGFSLLFIQSLDE
jgi:ankyrin repeat protein/uncharacterized glyoxalase superfamily protein PhnB